MPNPEGTIKRDGPNTTIVRITGMDGIADLPGVECENPGDSEEKRRYLKVFRQKKIYLPRQYDRAVEAHLAGTDTLVIGMNGYSNLSRQRCLDWGVKEDGYEAACFALFTKAIRDLQSNIDGINICIAHGASDVGVDRVAIEVARRLNLSQLGHSCPRFMFYVADDDIPVYVARTQEAYSKSFIRSLAILIAANGRAQAFEHDIEAVFKFRKHVIPVNVLRSISTNGGPPAFNAEGGIEDAVAAMEHLMHMATAQMYGDRDVFKGLCTHVSETIAVIARESLSPERAFGVYWPKKP